MTIRTPTLLNVERQGLTVVLHVKALDGERTQMRCGPREDIDPRAWQWSRNALASFMHGDPQGYLSITERDGRGYRFAVSTEEQLVHFKSIINSPVA